MRDLFSNGHEANALEEVGYRKQLARHGAEGERFTVVVLAGFEAGDDRRQLVLHQRKFFVPGTHRITLALDIFEACDEGTKIDVLAVLVLAVHEEILSQKGMEAEIAKEQRSREAEEQRSRKDRTLIMFDALKPSSPQALPQSCCVSGFGRDEAAC